MTSELQIRANQANAQLSTGPKTEAGKRRVALNGITHGLTAKPVVLHDEDAQAFEQLRAQLLSTYKPVGNVEMLHAGRAAVALWRLHRVLALEGRLLLARENPEEGETAAQCFQRDVDLVNRGLPGLSRYEQGLERSFKSAIELLQKAQEQRTLWETYQRGGFITERFFQPSPGPWTDAGSAEAVPATVVPEPGRLK